MPFPLHKSPSGLIELFKLQNTGRAPTLFGEQVTPTVDVTEFYANTLLTTVLLTNAAAAFPLVLQDVQTGPQKRYLAVGVDVTMGAAGGTYLHLNVGIEAPSAAFPFCPLFSTAIVANPVAGQSYQHGGMLETPLVPPPGIVLTVSGESDAAGADHVVAIRILAQFIANPNQ